MTPLCEVMMRRRAKRASLVGGVLEEFGFRVELNEDNVFSRLDGGDEEFMKSHLVLLGYLIMDSRQLDMVMANDASVAQFRSKMLKEIESILEKRSSSAATGTG